MDAAVGPITPTLGYPLRKIQKIKCSESGDTEGVSKNEAISQAKASRYVQSAIASEFGIQQYATPSWGACIAKKVDDGWTVTLKGNISGYTDDYRSNYVSNKRFIAIVEVSNSVFVNYFSISVDRL